MNRREFLMAAAASANLPNAPRTTMGVAATSYMTVARPRDTAQFLEQCHALGAGGIQAPLSSLDPAYIAKLRERLGELGMYLEVMVGLPKPDATEAFERTIAAAKQAGALCVRTACLGGRRYETFGGLEAWQKFVAESRAGIDRALRAVEKHQLPLAIENHKDWTVDEMTALMREKRHPLLGVALDTGNNISLLDDPMEVVEALAPFAFSTHIKDMGIEEYADGFLLAEVPFGEGMLDLRRIIEVIRAARPQTRFTLEMITRDPLRVPCLTDKYWATFPERSGRHLARTLRLARQWKPAEPLPFLEGLPKEAQRKVEDDNVRACLHYARLRLGLV